MWHGGGGTAHAIWRGGQAEFVRAGTLTSFDPDDVVLGPNFPHMLRKGAIEPVDGGVRYGISHQGRRALGVADMHAAGRVAESDVRLLGTKRDALTDVEHAIYGGRCLLREATPHLKAGASGATYA